MEMKEIKLPKDTTQCQYICMAVKMNQAEVGIFTF